MGDVVADFLDSVAPVINWSATSGTLALIFTWWHTWNYDRWRLVLGVHTILIPSHHEWEDWDRLGLSYWNWD